MACRLYFFRFTRSRQIFERCKDNEYNGQNDKEVEEPICDVGKRASDAVQAG